MAMLITSNLLAQKHDTENFKFQDYDIEYNRIDYSDYGINSFVITMFEDVKDNNNVLNESIDCLSKISNLYHTLYYFLEIPKEINSSEEKNKLFSKFIVHLKNTEKIDMVKLDLNFDSDYYLDYRTNYVSGYYVGSLKTKIDSKNFCKNL